MNSEALREQTPTGCIKAGRIIDNCNLRSNRTELMRNAAQSLTTKIRRHGETLNAE